MKRPTIIWTLRNAWKILTDYVLFFCTSLGYKKHTKPSLKNLVSIFAQIAMPSFSKIVLHFFLQRYNFSLKVLKVSVLKIVFVHSSFCKVQNKKGPMLKFWPLWKGSIFQNAMFKKYWPKFKACDRSYWFTRSRVCAKNN